MSRKIARVLAGVAGAGCCWMSPYRRKITMALISERLVPTLTVDTRGGPLAFRSPSARGLHDPGSLHSNEPETIRWLDALPEGSVLWDIGANVGTYALYAARTRGLRVLAFEPSASTYAALVRNIEINRLDGCVDAYCLAFDEATRLDYLHMAHTEAGHSMHAFGQRSSIEGEIRAVFRQSCLGLSVDAFMKTYAPPPPRHIKLDVDSIELKILKGAAATLNEHVESVLVEVDGADREATGAGIAGFLASIGFSEDADFMAAGSRRNVLFRHKGR